MATAPRPMPKQISVIVCTRDRAEGLRETLAAIGGCSVPPDVSAELIVVDNGSTDDTASAVQEARLPNLPVRYVLEPQPGLSHARNAGLRAANRAEIILFTDDDIRPPVDWIEGICRPILAGQADAVAGGVHFPADYAAWMAQEPFRSRRGWFAATDDLGNRPRRLVGANMAFSRRVVDTLGEFDPEVGAGARGFHDETLWSLRLLEAGFVIAAAPPGTSVEHRFDRARLTRAALLSMAERMGRSSAWVGYHWYQDPGTVPFWKLWRARWFLRALRSMTPWRPWQRTAPAWELGRVEVLSYLEALRGHVGQQRKYRNIPMS